MTKPRVVIVGGSLAGLVLALACARRGVATHVLERTRPGERFGGALGVDTAQLARVTGVDPLSEGEVTPLAVVHSNREATSWLALHDWLRGLVARRGSIRLDEGVPVEDVVLSPEPQLVLGDGRVVHADVVIGADGYRSGVRRAIDPDGPEPRYAGYMLWRGLVDERELPRATLWPGNRDGIGFIDAAGYRLIAYPVPGRDGSVRPGERQVSFAWYDTGRDRLLHDAGCLSPSGQVLATLAGSRLTAALRKELVAVAENHWPVPWRAAVLHALHQDTLFATPISEYLPRVLAVQRAAMLGDAAHVVSPATGRGFSTGLEDAHVLASVLGEVEGLADVQGALRLYEKSRLPVARQLVHGSMQWSDAYVRLHGAATEKPTRADVPR